MQETDEAGGGGVPSTASGSFDWGQSPPEHELGRREGAAGRSAGDILLRVGVRGTALFPEPHKRFTSFCGLLNTLRPA